MPDLKSELKKLEALKFDDDGDTTVITLPTATALPDDQQGGVSFRFFNIIKDNPGCNRKRLIELAEKDSISRASSSSLVTQFVKRKLIRKEHSASGFIYFNLLQKYKPGYVKQAKKAVKIIKVTKVVEAAPIPTEPKAPAPIPLAVFSAKDMVESMPVGKARALYVELKKLFEV